MSPAGRRRGAAALLLAAVLTLSGCSALLERPYAVVEPHTEVPALSGDDSTIQVNTYSELVNAVLFFVSQGREEGTIQLIDYSGDVESDLNRACLEVAKDDPLGAYAVDFIKNDYTRVLTTYEATLTIAYRRTQEQVDALVNVTGTSAIREEVEQALSSFRTELALRVGYFTGDAGSITQLVEQAYYAVPAAALGMPQIQVALYPETGTQRIVEILLTYSQPIATLTQKSADLRAEVEERTAPLLGRGESGLFQLTAQLTYNPQGGSTAWDALLGEGADSEGMALAFQLLAQALGVESELVEGTLDGAPHFFNRLTGGDEAHYVDLTRDADGTTWSAEDLTALGYAWPQETGEGQ